MKKKIMLILVMLVLSFGCARVKVEGTKDPIKVDISMRLDIYQHVVSDIDSIEDIVSGTNKSKDIKDDKQSLLELFFCPAYAQEGLSQEAQDAVLRRRDRYPKLVLFQEKGVVGENKSGLVQVRQEQKADPELREFIQSENKDRMLIYTEVARKNNVSIEDVQELYAKRLQEDSPQGTPIEIINQATGQYEWMIK